jgi:hypothetical protein
VLLAEILIRLGRLDEAVQLVQTSREPKPQHRRTPSRGGSAAYAGKIHGAA